MRALARMRAQPFTPVQTLSRERALEEAVMSERANFRQFYRDAHAVDNLSEREKIFIGLAVAFVRNCQP
jgi:hypothetical protein